MMRAAKDNKPGRIALRKAVRAEQGNRPINGSWTEANAILESVNSRLGKEGFEPVNVDSVRRVLAALLKSAEK
jgi:hypothetical protein